MRICDWSSDVCSSDLSWMVYTAGSILVIVLLGLWLYVDELPQGLTQKPAAVTIPVAPESEPVNDPFNEHVPTPALPAAERMRERKSVVEGKSVSVRVDIGGCRIFKKKKKKNRA